MHRTHEHALWLLRMSSHAVPADKLGACSSRPRTTPGQHHSSAPWERQPPLSVSVEFFHPVLLLAFFAVFPRVLPPGLPHRSQLPATTLTARRTDVQCAVFKKPARLLRGHCTGKGATGNRQRPHHPLLGVHHAPPMPTFIPLFQSPFLKLYPSPPPVTSHSTRHTPVFALARTNDARSCPMFLVPSCFLPCCS